MVVLDEKTQSCNFSCPTLSNIVCYYFTCTVHSLRRLYKRMVRCPSDKEWQFSHDYLWFELWVRHHFRLCGLLSHLSGLSFRVCPKNYLGIGRKGWGQSSCPSRTWQTLMLLSIHLVWDLPYEVAPGAHLKSYSNGPPKTSPPAPPTYVTRSCGFVLIQEWTLGSRVKKKEILHKTIRLLGHISKVFNHQTDLRFSTWSDLIWIFPSPSIHPLVYRALCGPQ